MIKFISKLFKSVAAFWKKFSRVQRIIALAIGLLLFSFVIFLSLYSTRESAVFLFTNGIKDEALLGQITMRLDQEGLPYTVDGEQRIKVENLATARYLRNILIRENLLPGDTDPWELFDVSRWTQTDFEKNVNLQRSLTKQIEQHIESLDDVDNVEVTLVMPEDSLFISDRKPVTASVILVVKPGSDIRENRKKLEGIEQLILFSIEGLLQENLTISDSSGIRLNNFEDFADFDDLELTKRQLEIKSGIETEYTTAIYEALSGIYTADRVRIVNINVEMDFSKKTQETTENYPIVVKEDKLETPYDESEVVLSIVRSQEQITQTYKGSGFNPEGPPGVEGQVPPSYKDIDGLIAEWDHDTNRINNEINQRKILEEKRPVITRVTASVALDGIWYTEYDDNGAQVINPNGSIQRRHEGLTELQLRQAKSLVEGAVGYSVERNDVVTVENIQFDRTAYFAAEDARIRARLRLYRILRYSGIGILALALIIFLFRFFSQLIENYRLRKEEELANRYRRMREEQIASFKVDDTQASELDIISNEIIGRVRQNPADVVKLIKLWIDEPPALMETRNGRNR